MRIWRSFKWALNRVLARFGFRLARLPRQTRGGLAQAERLSMDGVVKVLAERGLSLKTVIDVGASDGQWSEATRARFPTLNYMLVEAQPVHAPALEAYCRRRPNTQFILSAAGDTVGEIYFDARNPFGGHASHIPYPTHNLVVPVTTLDALVKDRRLEGPFLLKLDTHGFEVAILNGMSETLPMVEAIVIECYNFRLTNETLLFDEMCAHLRPLGFRCIDVADIVHRPSDNSFWQADLVFVRASRPEFASNDY